MFRNVSRRDWFALIFQAALWALGWALAHKVFPDLLAVNLAAEDTKPAEIGAQADTFSLFFAKFAPAVAGLILLAMMFPRGIIGHWMNTGTGQHQRVLGREYGYVMMKGSSASADFYEWWRGHIAYRGLVTWIPGIWLLVAMIILGLPRLPTSWDYGATRQTIVELALIIFPIASLLMVMGYFVGMVFYPLSLWRRNIIPRDVAPTAADPTKQQPHGPVSDEGTI